MDARQVLCVGELLWDALPGGLFLGGAPFNVAAHLRALGVPVAMITRVGADRLGREAAARLAGAGVAAELVQTDPAHETGFVTVVLDGDGSPCYQICEPAAWDFLALEPGLLQRAARAAALVFGSLAQRNPVSRDTIRQLCEAAPCTVFDVNLRPPYDDPEIVRESLGHADIVKINQDELAQLCAWFGLPPDLREASAALSARFACETVCVTRGAHGAALLHGGRWTEHPGFRVQVRDTVGAGDAFLAALVAGLLAGDPEAVLLERANRLGAEVAARTGGGAVLAPPDTMKPGEAG